MTIRLRAVSRTQGNNAALKSGRVAPRGFPLDWEEVPVLVQAFRRMVREQAYDVCEMALTTYLCAREHGVPFTAIPVFLVRDFHHGAIQVNRTAGIMSPKDLEGREVGVNRGYTVTTGVWARAILAEEHGVDLSRITWVLSGDEHVASYVPPSNVVPLPAGQKMEDELASGRLPAAIGVTVDSPDVGPLIAEPLAAGLAAFDARGHWPINHLVVVRDDVLAANPGLAAALFEAFVESKRLYLDDLHAGRIKDLTAIDRLHATLAPRMGGDPLPYGLAPNRHTLDTLIAHATAQGILTRPVVLDDLFAAETRGLAG
ncbi:MAG: ABC transporter substrate-binding protein [Rhodobacteraceae bacterium]|nr:ABC transporter substrate-binding protein [Paracoccaceae bacterium]